MAEIPKIELVLADVDGTLVTREKILTPRAVRAVEKLRARGIRFAITSGRPPKGMDMLVEPLKIDEPIAGFNGGMFVHPDLSIIEAKTLAPAAAEKAVKVLRDHGLDVWTYIGNDWLVAKEDAPHVAREQWTVKFPPNVVADPAADLDAIVKIVGVSDDADLMKRAERDVQEALGKTASAALSQPYYLDITHPHANKGDVVASLSRLLGIEAGRIATLGDQPNDVLMFRRSGVSIAMGQASAEVQAEATYVSASSEEEGFAKGVERYILGEGSGD